MLLFQEGRTGAVAAAGTASTATGSCGDVAVDAGSACSNSFAVLRLHSTAGPWSWGV